MARPRGTYATGDDHQRHPHHDYRKVGRKIVDHQIQFGAVHVCYPSFLFPHIFEFRQHQRLEPCDFYQMTTSIQACSLRLWSHIGTVVSFRSPSSFIQSPHSCSGGDPPSPARCRTVFKNHIPATMPRLPTNRRSRLPRTARHQET